MSGGAVSLGKIERVENHQKFSLCGGSLHSCLPVIQLIKVKGSKYLVLLVKWSVVSITNIFKIIYVSNCTSLWLRICVQCAVLTRSQINLSGKRAVSLIFPIHFYKYCKAYIIPKPKYIPLNTPWAPHKLIGSMGLPTKCWARSLRPWSIIIHI